MEKEIEFEAKNIKEAMNHAKEVFKVDESKIAIELIKEKKGFLGIGGSNIYKASLNINLLDEGKEYLGKILNEMNVQYKMEARNVEGGLYYSLETEENSLIIGKDGRCLDALNVLLRVYLESFFDSKLIVTLDIGGYRDNRRRQLEILATKTAKDVARTHIAVKLKPMNSFERLIIHEKLSEWRDVYTESEGEGEDRCLVIKPKNK